MRSKIRTTAAAMSRVSDVGRWNVPEPDTDFCGASWAMGTVFDARSGSRTVRFDRAAQPSDINVGISSISNAVRLARDGNSRG